MLVADDAHQVPLPFDKVQYHDEKTSCTPSGISGGPSVHK